MTTLERLATLSVTPGRKELISKVTSRGVYKTGIEKTHNSFKCLLSVTGKDVLSQEELSYFNSLKGKNYLYRTYFPNKDNDKGYTFYRLEKAYMEGEITSKQATLLAQQKLESTQTHRRDMNAVKAYTRTLSQRNILSTTVSKSTISDGEKNNVFSTDKLLEGVQELTQPESLFQQSRKVLETNIPLAYSILYDALSVGAMEYAQRLDAESKYLEKPNEVFLEEWEGQRKQDYHDAIYDLSRAYVEFAEELGGTSNLLSSAYRDLLRRDPIKMPNETNQTRQTRQLYQRIRRNLGLS